MIDFLIVSTRSAKRGIVEIYPKFIIKKSSDLMIRGGDFYAVWIEERGLWSTDEQDALQLIDRELDRYAEEKRQSFGGALKVLHMWDAESGMIDSWHKYCQKQMRDSFQTLDEKLIFSNMAAAKDDYASKKLSYPLKAGDFSAFDKLMSVLYSVGERKKIEWAIGAVVSGDSKKIQKFMVLYGAAGTGKSTVINIIQQLFDGYCSVFDAKSLGSASNAFALEAFKSNPLVAIQHDGDLSRIKDNTKLNSLVSHETMTVNEKFKSAYSNSFKCFLFVGTNQPVEITDAKSGLLRRLIDVSPTGEKLRPREYQALMRQIPFELGAIAHHCREAYLNDPGAYDDYIPLAMLGATNDFYNFVLDSYHVFKREDKTTLKAAWEMYKAYCDEAKVPFPYSMKKFKEELKSYFREYLRRAKTQFEDGTRPYHCYVGFRSEKIDGETEEKAEDGEDIWLTLDGAESLFDRECAGCPAQYASSKETPLAKWDSVKTRLSDLDASRLHYVKVPEGHIVIDFDILDESGEKSLEKNLKAAGKWPPTYAELSKSGAGIHLHYHYTGDPATLSRVYGEHIEVKAFLGNSSLRRRLSKCNGLPIATISSGLPLKGEKMVNFEAIKSERGLRALLMRNLNKEIHPGTKPSVDFMHKILEDAYNSGLHYDVTDLRGRILAFAAGSTHQADYCIKLVNRMRFKSDEASINVEGDEGKLVFYDVEVFPNLFLVNWKVEGEGKPVVRMINPSPTEIEELMRFRLVGFNCRRYDNHILYARLMGYSNEQLYRLSQKIVNGSANCFFGEAYNVSYTDVYDFSSKKQSLKKFEIELGIHHQELGLPWDQPVPKELWTRVAEYCDNDVIATEAVFFARKADFTARRILADLAGMTVNDTTNTLTTRIIFGKERKPQGKFQYRFMGVDEAPFGQEEEDFYNVFDAYGRPEFPGYTFDHGKSTYRGESVGEGGYVYAEPGMYGNVALLDISSMHPSSIVAENLFGDEYTQRFKEILDARIAVKHRDFEKARKLLGGVLGRYLTDEESAADLAQALKIAINSVYGLTSATFENPFRDVRNQDNIVAKRGALFMINLKHEVQRRGFTVAHIKTDSIKIPDATPEIIQFVMDFGKRYGYAFEHEATYEKMCLVNDAVYIAKYKDGKCAGEWTATGAQFAVPYVFKKLFSKDDIAFKDLCETKSVSTALYLDMNEGLPDVSAYEKELDKACGKFRKGELSDTTFEKARQELAPLIEKGHNYIFVGKVGCFCPIKAGRGGGLLMREKDGRYYAVTGTKGCRWLESEMVKELEKQPDIDEQYYISMVDDAVAAISKYGDFERFVSDEPYVKERTQPDFMEIPEDAEEEIPFN